MPQDRREIPGVPRHDRVLDRGRLRHPRVHHHPSTAGPRGQPAPAAQSEEAAEVVGIRDTYVEVGGVHMRSPHFADGKKG